MKPETNIKRSYLWINARRWLLRVILELHILFFYYESNCISLNIGNIKFQRKTTSRMLGLIRPWGRCECNPDGVYSKVFPIYIPSVNENWGLKNTSMNWPFSKSQKPLSLKGKCPRAPDGDNGFLLILINFHLNNQN